MAVAEKIVLDAARSALVGGRRGHGRVVLAVSGGIDSMTLLDAARRVLDPGEIVVATFDHGTGDAARAAADLVRARADDLGLAREAARASRSLRSEAELRDARWAFLREVAARVGGPVVTAHTADDQTETVLMRVMRGAGARGLAALHAPGGPLRPFLELSRATIARYARDRGLEWVEDPSNDSRAFFRNRVRHDLLPALRAVCPGLPDDLADIGKRAAAWRRDVDAFVTEHISVHASTARDTFEVELAPLTHMARSELAVLWPSIASRLGLVLDRRGLARLSEFTGRSRIGSRIQLSGGWSVVRSRDGLTFGASTHVSPTPGTIDQSGGTRWGPWSFTRRDEGAADPRWSSRLPSDAILTVRAWAPGDRIRSPRGTSRKVKELLSKAGVTGHKRTGWPVVLAGDEIVWIPGVWWGGSGSKITERLGTAGVTFICEYIDR